VGKDESALSESLRVYELYRARVSQEDALVNHRMGWFLWSNAILFGFLVGLTSVSNANSAATNALLLRGPWFVISAGVLCTLSSMFVINAALDEIEHLRTIYRAHHPQNVRAENEGRIPGLVGHRHHHFIGKCVPLMMPVIVLILWVALGFLKASG
jgi:hypothetical protein